MEIIKCGMEDTPRLAAMNKKLIEDEQSDNAMNIEELQNRMAGFLSGDYSAYFFSEQDEIIGYALIRHTSDPVYLRQFYIDRPYRRQHKGKQAFRELMAHLGLDTVDIDVLPWNERGLSFWKSCGFTETCVSMRYKR